VLQRDFVVVRREAKAVRKPVPFPPEIRAAVFGVLSHGFRRFVCLGKIEVIAMKWAGSLYNEDYALTLISERHQGELR
jgi:hypothetical protein